VETRDKLDRVSTGSQAKAKGLRAVDCLFGYNQDSMALIFNVDNGNVLVRFFPFGSPCIDDIFHSAIYSIIELVE